MPKHVFQRGPVWPAPQATPIVLGLLIGASALGAAVLRSPSAPAGTTADPIARWLGDRPRERVAGAPSFSLPDLPLRLVAGSEVTGPATEPIGEPAPDAQAASPAVAEAVAATAAAAPAPADAAPSTAYAAPPPAAADASPASATPPAPAVAAADHAVSPPPATPVAEAKAEPAGAVPSRWREHTVRKGETLAQVLKTFGVDKGDRAKVIAAAKGTPALIKLKVGQKIRGRVDGDGGLLELQLMLDAKSSVHVELAADDFRVHAIDRPVEKRLTQASAVIQSSLFVDGQDAGLSDAQIMELAAIFGWEVDFALGLRPGDRFSLIYEAEYLDGDKVDNGAILAAEFVNQGRSYRAVRFEDDDGSLGYYAPDGTSKKQAFLRSPLKLARVSSGFSLSRQHPILNTRRAHKGVDYSAPVGTPVKATGSGLVAFTGQKNGYGNVIELQHGEKYSTLYGHLSRFAEGLRVGEPVKQGEVIGYVGQTGLATGPHLHYEFRVAGEHRDPLTTKLPTAEKLDGQDFAAFRKRSAPLLAQLDRMERTMLARAP
jgi:murein DD-endopeptidase MepM/ murein hydrolase activator NlpD